MKRVFAGLVATFSVAGSIAFSGGASAATFSDIRGQPIGGYGYVGRFWCDDGNARTKNGAGSIGIQIHSSDFDGRGQTIRVKAVDPRDTNNTLARTDFFSIPNATHDATLDRSLFDGEKFRICAEFGVGDSSPDHLYRWSGLISY